MKLTLSNCMQRINQILNYPSVSYEDISHFFDQAIAEINTIVKIAIPSVSEMVLNNTIDISLQINTVHLTTTPTNATPITHVSEVPIEAPAEGDPTYVHYTKNTSALDRMFYVWNGTVWVPYTTLYGVQFQGVQKRTYVATPVGFEAYWVQTDSKRTIEFDLCEYLPSDWWTLFVIPYVCFKFSVRNGDSGELFVTEFSQGLQQLQTCYDVPNFVTLKNVAGNPVYTEIVKENINDLTKKVPTRAITEAMRVGSAINATFGNMFDTGGWGV